MAEGGWEGLLRREDESCSAFGNLVSSCFRLSERINILVFQSHPAFLTHLS
jgi:hypothetical protein